MNASALKYDSTDKMANTGVVHPGWQMLGQFATVEASRAVVDRLQAKGIEARTVLIDGVTVIVRSSI